MGHPFGASFGRPLGVYGASLGLFWGELKASLERPLGILGRPFRVSLGRP